MRRSAPLPRARRAVRWPLALVSLALLTVAAGCPTPPSPHADTLSDGEGDDADTTSTTNHPDTEVIVPDECLEASDCEEGAVLPACKGVDCVDKKCVVIDLADGLGCDDGDPCTTGESCVSGACVASESCDDGNPCTTDGCDPDNGCVHTFNQLPCDDGSLCTSEDRCFQGACTGVALDIDDQNQCTTDSCDAVLGVQHTPRTGACDDGDACTDHDTCVAGACVPGDDVVCGDPDNPCIVGSCDPDEGCQIEIVSGECDDGNACTENDSCIEGVCTGPTVTCNDLNPCTDDYCDTAIGCTTVDNVLPCDDGDVCTVDDVCREGQCEPGDANPACCTVGDDAACADADPCTVDVCDDGLCANTPLDCDDSRACTADRCVGGTCENPSWGPAGDAPATVSDFEGAGALEGWSFASDNANVTWQLDALDPHGGGGVLYCGATPAYSYDFGKTTADASRALSLPPGNITLRFWAKVSFEENTSCIFDVLRVTVDGEELTPICSSLDVWTEQTYDLSAYAGGDVTLTLTFDTFDDQANNGGGVWIDDVTLEVDNDLACCVDAGDCDDGDPCTTDTCGDDSACDHVEVPSCP
ncbi:MAG: hypothetical protein EP329_15365 [Deltaproteobacteria bacterium]|nr:MAG: hypothetical protein EP329_15365 [Deltaproteobacteria bacterium]